MYSRPTAPKSIGGVLDDIFKLYVVSLPHVWPIALISAAISFVPAIYIALQFGSNPGQIGSNPEAALELLTSPAVWGSYVLLMVVSLLFMVAMLLRVANVAAGEEGSIAAAIARSIALLPRTIGATILYILIYIVGAILLIIPGIIWSVSFLLAGAFIAIEDAGAIESLKCSRRLVKGNWWRTLAILTIALIVAYLLLFCVQLVSSLAGTQLAVDPTTVLIVTTVISGALHVVVVPLYAAAVLGVYFDLKLRKEGDDLAERVAALDKT